MLPKNNQYSVRSHEKHKKDKEQVTVNIHNHSLQATELKRAFTVLPSTASTTSLKQTQPSNRPEKVFQQKNVEETEWPSIEELEAIIRGEQEQQHTEVEWLELPLEFDRQRELPSSEAKEDNHIHAEHVQQQINLTMPPATYTENDGTNQVIITENKEYDSTLEYTHTSKDYYLDEPKKIEYISMSWGKITTAIVSSIITGVLIGYVLLLALYGVQVWPINVISEKIAESEVTLAPSDSETIAGAIIGDQVAGADINNEVESVITPAVQTEPATIVIQPVQTFTYTAFQAGVFSKQDTKQAMLNQLKAQGYPAIDLLTYDGNYVVFTGLASSQQATYQINHMDKTEVYKKSYSLHVPHLSENEQLDAELQQWMFNIQDLLTSYMKISEAQFEQSSFSAIYAESYNLLREKSKQVLQETANLKAAITDAMLLEKIEWHQQAIKKTDTLLDQYQQAPSITSLFAVEQQLLDIIAYESQWFNN